MTSPVRSSPLVALVALVALGGCFDFDRFREVPPDAMTSDGSTDLDGSIPDSGSDPMCEPGFANCDPDTLGCETDVRLDRENCGDCSVACGTLEGCFGGCAEVDFAWNVTATGPGNDSATAVAADAGGSLWLGGSFNQQLSFDGVEIDRGPSIMGIDGYIVRIRQSDGTVLTPLRDIAGASGNTSVVGLLPGPSNGTAWIAVNAGSPPATIAGGTWRACSGVTCGWVARLTAMSSFSASPTAQVVLRTIDADGIVTIDSVIALDDGSIVVGGRAMNGASSFTFRADGEGGSFAERESSGPRSFLVRFSSAGTVLSASLFNVASGALFAKMAPLPGGEIAAAGPVREASLVVEGEFDPVVINDFLLQRYTLARVDPADGTIRWLDVFVCGSASGQNAMLGLDTDGAGNLYGLVDCDGGSLSLGGADVGEMRVGNSRIFLGSWTSEGQHRWSRPFGSGLLGLSASSALVVDGLLLVTTRVIGGQAEVDLGAGPIATTGVSDAVLAAFDLSSGAFVWGRLLGSSPGAHLYLQASASRARSVFVVGSFSGTFDGVEAESSDVLAARLDLP